MNEIFSLLITVLQLFCRFFQRFSAALNVFTHALNGVARRQAKSSDQGSHYRQHSHHNSL
jgi:hypothetical protein